jgi:hypothetical protein
VQEIPPFDKKGRLLKSSRANFCSISLGSGRYLLEHKVEQHGPYSRRDLHKAVIASAILGWLWVTLYSVNFDLRYLPLLLPLAAIVGLPIAFIATYLIGMPILWSVMRKSVTYQRAALGGGLIAALMAMASTAIGRYMGWRQSLNDNHGGQVGGGDYVQSIDGILTPYGWWVVLRDSMLLIAVGMVIGVLMRAWIGPGRQPSS